MYIFIPHTINNHPEPSTINQVDVIEGLSPSLGKASGGTRVEISGGGFDVREVYIQRKL